MHAIIGATLGAATGVAASTIVRNLTDWPILVTAEAIVRAMVFAAGIGLVFSYVPARRAAALQPAEALRAV